MPTLCALDIIIQLFLSFFSFFPARHPRLWLRIPPYHPPPPCRFVYIDWSPPPPPLPRASVAAPTPCFGNQF